MHPYSTLNSAILNDAGLNCQAVFALAELPQNLQEKLFSACPQAKQYRQLLLFGHGGKRFWQALREHFGIKAEAEAADIQALRDADPVDRYSETVVREFLLATQADASFEFVYPGPFILNLQDLGALAGWHHPSPLMVGMNAEYGTWFAYRALVLANTDFSTTNIRDELPTEDLDSPCQSCSSRACMHACPANAIAQEQFNLSACLSYRQQDNSLCAQNCVARYACPVASEHRYTEEQMHYHYGQSLRMLSFIN